MAEQYNQREQMEKILREGGSVYHRGAIIANPAGLPLQSVLAKGDVEREAAARTSLQRQRDAIDAELQVLSSPNPPTTTVSAPMGVSDELPEDFPGFGPLIEAGYTKKSEVAALSDDELDAIEGIGPATVKNIREVLR